MAPKETEDWICDACGEFQSTSPKLCVKCGCPDDPSALFDPVNRPEHYNTHPSGVECVAITEHMTCMIGSAIKYLWRHGLKAGADADQDLRKAIWCIERERSRIAHMKAATNGK
jgi:hypothetical protein